MKKMFFYFFLLVLTGCKWQDPTLKTLKTCQKPTAVTATPNATNPRQYTFVLSGVTTDVAFPVTWKQGSTTLGTSTSATFSYTFGADGNFTITAEVTTVCGEKIALSANTSIKTCTLPTEISVSTDPADVRKFTFGVQTNVPSDISSVVWRTVSVYKDQSYGSLKAADKITYTVTSSEVVVVTAVVQTTCGQSLTLTKNVSAEFKVWDKTFGGTGTEELRSIVPTSDGGYLLGGFSNSNGSGEKSENGRGNEDYWVVKINTNGQKVWDKTFGGNGDDALLSMTITSDGGFLLAGHSSSPSGGDKSENSRGGLDYWVIKINANGQKMWDKTFGGNNTEYFHKVIATSDGGFLLSGITSSNISGEKSENNRGSWDWWIVKINANGQKVWDKTIGGLMEDYFEMAAATSDGGYLLGGWSESNISGEKSENSRGSYDYWVVKINANGQKMWDKTFGGAGYDVLKTVTSTSDGGFLLGGISPSNKSVDKSDNSKGETDYWIVKVNANGQKLWDKTLGGNGYEGLYSSINSLDSDFLLLGNSASGISEDKTEVSRGGFDYWLIKTDSNGQKRWDKTFGGNENDYPQIIISLQGGGFIIAGKSESNISGEKSENSRGGSDFWVIKVK